MSDGCVGVWCGRLSVCDWCDGGVCEYCWFVSGGVWDEMMFGIVWNCLVLFGVELCVKGINFKIN